MSKRHECRSCGGQLSIPFCDLGLQPLANSYVPLDQKGEAEPHFPLNVMVCDQCKLAQLDHVADSAAIFSHYAYLSSASKGWLEHARHFCAGMTKRLALGPQSFVVEVASNDGYLLKNFVDAGIPCLGVEPAANVAAIAHEKGVPTEVAFFGRDTATRLRARHGSASLIVANNVLAHVPDINDFIAGFATLCDEKTVISIECPHLLQLIENTQFDTIYHEHYSYWSLYSAERALARHGLEVVDLERLPTHGGSLRFIVMQQGVQHQASIVTELRRQEAAAGLDKAEGYQGFMSKVAKILQDTHDYLLTAKKNNLRIAGYGAAAKGNTFLNALKARYPQSDALLAMTMVADVNSLKQNTLLPGTQIPVVSPQALIADRPDDVLILPWNIAAEVKASLRSKGFQGRFVTAIPSLVIDDY